MHLEYNSPQLLTQPPHPIASVPILVIVQRSSTLETDLFCFDMFYKYMAPFNWKETRCIE